MLISSHILDELSRLATYYGFIDKGRIIKEMSAEELEAQCGKCVRVKVSDVKALSKVMEEQGLDYKIISDSEADIYGQIGITKLTQKLSENDCELISIHEHDESLESYFMNLVGGGHT